MLGLWSMAARLQGCHCRACLRTTNTTIARQPTTTTITSTRRIVTNPRRKKVLASDVFTACYSAIMATAAVLDARTKKEKRRDLERQIDEAKDRLRALRGDSERMQPPPLTEVVKESRKWSVLGALESVCRAKNEVLEEVGDMTWDRIRQVKKLRRDLDITWHYQTIKGTTTLPALSGRMAVEEAHARYRPGDREAKTESHIIRTAEMINKLVDRLLEEAYWISEAEAPGTHPALSSPDSAMTMIRLLRSDGYPRYTYPGIDLEATAEARANLNEVVRKILSQFARPWRERAVAKICYNLLVCTHPPSIHNYNALIWSFAQLGEYRLAEVVVENFLYDSHLKPTETTSLCLLQHYRMTNNITGFYNVMRRLIGSDPRGIGLMRRHEEDVPTVPSLRRWAKRKRKVAHTNAYYVYRHPLTQYVVEGILEGLLDFFRTADAAKVLVAALKERWLVSFELFNRLLHQCVTMLDARAGGIIIQGLVDNIGRATSLILRREGFHYREVKKLRRITSMLEAMPKQLLPPEEKTSRGFWRLQRAIRLREISADLNQIGRAIELVQTLVLPQTRESLGLVQLDMAVEALDITSAWQQEEQDTIDRLKRLAKIQWVYQQYIKADREIVRAEHIFSNAVGGSLPPTLRTTTHFNPHIPVHVRVAQALPYVTIGSDQYEVAGIFLRVRELDVELKVSLIMAMPQEYIDLVNQEALMASGDVDYTKLFRIFANYLETFDEHGPEEAASASRWTESGGRFSRLLGVLPRFWARTGDARA
ncbi:hypothetical protein QBC35DRAFT_378561 [Podospora australis]|uniref:Pentatricopeptide repeat domain-containing protein n=1 Tax=Podospora australis TaxID=1536484 RepID=A0AAN6X2C4_9PEZI|nr:hypothetical protein QBC35DRAFT_378561 [Podospora australis]